MDAALLDIVAGIPPVTKIWAIGCVGLSILTSTNAIDPTKKWYTFELAFKKGQYDRIIYSLFDHGEFNWMSIFNIFVSVNHLASLENSFAIKRRFCWMVTIALGIILLMSSIAQPVSSLGIVLYENLVYYQIRKTGNEMNIMLFGGVNVSPLILPLYMNCTMLFVHHKTMLQVAMNFLPGHALYYLDDIFMKLYDVDLCKTPYDFWLDYRRR
ncbi:hypothetical protein HG535_0A05560 [Zygotorulaspora mrakii]|uniref:Derlin n=1 Tax=Zygotorulaspora mrakii TaxID=42260 RepID=A0A7H9AWA1_ZYGMR|nr:uncharacterized protein HG535_0A05560 [Zygotorulaspora mrakii]QLG70615.1 hypothetical protein HG535_0A05560 [Zygotorulaspora mrakii]